MKTQWGWSVKKTVVVLVLQALFWIVVRVVVEVQGIAVLGIPLAAGLGAASLIMAFVKEDQP